ncbi:hypothetical protein Anae109_3338 [Anaeromyxobacter sp. Fw109-5]|nr:hypothetical protein Anae109_3338 [Anaeromyxobacter sp. Fw109-5]
MYRTPAPLFDEFVPQRVARELHVRARADLGGDPRPVRGDRLLAQPELRGDLLQRPRARDQAQRDPRPLLPDLVEQREPVAPGAPRPPRARDPAPRDGPLYGGIREVPQER